MKQSSMVVAIAASFSQLLSLEVSLQYKRSRFKMMFIWYMVASLTPVAGAWGEFGRRNEDERLSLLLRNHRVSDGTERHIHLPLVFNQHHQNVNELRKMEMYVPHNTELN